MDRIRELLALGAAITDEQRAELLQLIAELPQADLEDASGVLVEASNTLLDADPDDDTLAALGVVSAASAALRERSTALADDAARRERERAELAESIAANLNGDPEPDPGEGGEGEGDDAGEGDDDAGADDAGAAPAEGGEPAAEPEAAPVAVAAAAGQRPIIANVNARRPASAQPRTPATAGYRAPLTAAGAFAGHRPGVELDPEQEIRVWEEAYLATRNYVGGFPKIPVVSTRAGRAAFGEDRFLTGDSALNTRKVNAVASPRAIAAAGGHCQPINVDYSLPTVGSTERPVRDALVRFGAEARGGISTLPPPILGDAAAGVTVWTAANDLAALPGGAAPDPATKAFLRVTCPEAETTTVDAIVGGLLFGNFGLRYFREQGEAWQRLLAVEVARVAENKLLDVIADHASTVDVNVAELLSTERDVLAGLDRAMAQYRYVNRDPNLRFTWIAPGWMQDNIRTSVARGIPVGTMDETLALADAAIARWFAVRGITPAWHLDGETGQGFPVQGDGALAPWPDTAVTYLFIAGEWLYVDGGEFVAGLYRDSGTNPTNDAQFFGEIFENAHHHGRQTKRLVFDIVPNGTYSCCTEIDIASSGS